MNLDIIDQHNTSRRERDSELRLLKGAIMAQLAPNIVMVRLMDPTLPPDLEAWPVSSVTRRV